MRQVRVQTIIMGGGVGSRLFPLTKGRCKPAVPIGGKYRLVDIAISNSIHSGYNQIYLLTQYHTRSLHRHISGTYNFDPFAGGFVEVLPAEQVDGKDHTWYEGTADAVRKNLDYINLDDDDLVLILAGDHLYRMDFSNMVKAHLETNAEVTISGKIVSSSVVRQLGVMELFPDMRIRNFEEKPNTDEQIRRLLLPRGEYQRHSLDPNQSYCVASMGNYLFRFATLKRALEGNDNDFGKNVLPKLLSQGTAMYSYLFDGYWEDIGSVRSFFDANLALTDIIPPFDFFDEKHPIFTKPRYLPASKINGCSMERVIIGDGCFIDRAILRRCVIGIRSVIRENSSLEDVLVMGNNTFEKRHTPNGYIPCGIGKNCYIRKAIIDKDSRIGNRVRLVADGKPNGYESNGCSLVDGIICVPERTVLHDDFIF
ncbi:MAG: glucose-1-phosphate adenylyltransferase [Puniceicoccales bacterium]|jgi:glucose-1-phosphate adenylyltransferase|nr:glucose-1-phosphate adenylyltransferase [Puniceicoccales bacterium]